MKYAQAEGRRGPGRRGRSSSDERTTSEQRQKITAWFKGRVPEAWFVEPVEVLVDDDEILVMGTLAPVELPESATDQERETAQAARIQGYREDTRDQRMRIAEEAQQSFGRHVSWGARCAESAYAFTTASVPVMTRLHIRDRQVLDTLIDAGVARSRSEALAWCVRLVGKNEETWIADLRSAFEHVDEVRSRGPESGGA
jgi:hypothetical protein